MASLDRSPPPYMILLAATSAQNVPPAQTLGTEILNEMAILSTAPTGRILVRAEYSRVPDSGCFAFIPVPANTPTGQDLLIHQMPQVDIIKMSSIRDQLILISINVINNLISFSSHFLI